MKTIRLACVCILLLCSGRLLAQSPYVMAPDPEHPKEWMALGILHTSLLKNTPEYQWFNTNQNGYTPDSSLIEVMANPGKGITLLVFGGTWCDDTRFILPKLYKWIGLSGFPEKQVSLFGVDRDKKIPGNLTNVLQVTNVPTMIVLKDGKETGRVVEYGKTGKWDVELAEIIRNSR